MTSATIDDVWADPIFGLAQPNHPSDSTLASPAERGPLALPPLQAMPAPVPQKVLGDQRVVVEGPP